MACNLTQGFTLDCRDAVGGIKTIYVARLSDVVSTTLASGSGLVTAITMASGSDFYEYQMRKQTGNYTETITTSDENGTLFFAQEVTIQLPRTSVQKRNELFLLAQNDIVAIVKDRNDNHLLFGKTNGLTLAGNNSSGTAMGDFNGYALTFTGAEEKPAVFVTGSIIAGLL